MLSDTIKTLIRNAWDDGYPCLVATNGPQGPNITPKGSMIVFDYQHLAWWERTKRAYDAMEKAFHEEGVMVRNMGDTLAVTPPLIVSESQTAEIFDKMARVIRAVA